MRYKYNNINMLQNRLFYPIITISDIRYGQSYKYIISLGNYYLPILVYFYYSTMLE